MPIFPSFQNVDQLVISPASPQSLGEFFNSMGASIGSLAWPVANKAYSIPFFVYSPITIAKMFILNGSAVSGNVDVGIYEGKGVAKIVSSGSTAQSGTNVIQEFDITDTLLNPGIYFMALSIDNTTATIQGWGISSVIGRSVGIHEKSSSFPLPSTLGFTQLSGTTRIPFIGLSQRPVI